RLEASTQALARLRLGQESERPIKDSTPLGQQQMAAVLDRNLRDLGKSLQQPWQCDLQPDMIVRNIEMTGRPLPQRAHAKDHAIALPSLLIDREHRNAGGRARQSCLEAAGRLFAAEAMRNRNDER